jgi:L-alanine-DL-glutamate epimerase-like enolase superfamily enzyme
VSRKELGVKITDIKVETKIVPVEHQFVWRKGLPGSGTEQDTIKLTVETDEGVTGVAHGSHGAIMQDIINRRIRDDLVGQDPLLKESLWTRVWELDRIEEIPLYGLGLIDIALWDLTAKVANLPLYKVLGGARDRIPAYASTVTYSTIEEFLDIADQCLEAGFRAIKLHAWGDPKADAKLGQALRNHVGPDIELMYDGSAGFDLLDAIYVGRALHEAGFLWYEEPMREFNIQAYRRLHDRVDIALLSGETSDGAHYNIADFIANDACDLVRTSTHYKGGVTGAMRVAHLAESFNMRAEVHGGGHANLAIACAIPNTTWYESLVRTNPIIVEDGIGPDGCISPPDVPGIGWGTPLG